MAAADALHLAYPSAVLFLALTAIYTSLFGISVSISRQFRRNARLMQEMAILEMRLRQLEMRADKGASEQPEA
jgi:type II secretory pathway component PulJ